METRVLGFGMQDWVEILKVWGLRSGVWGLGFGVLGVGFGVSGF